MDTMRVLTGEVRDEEEYLCHVAMRGKSSSCQSDIVEIKILKTSIIISLYLN